MFRQVVVPPPPTLVPDIIRNFWVHLWGYYRRGRDSSWHKLFPKNTRKRCSHMQSIRGYLARSILKKWYLKLCSNWYRPASITHYHCYAGDYNFNVQGGNLLPTSNAQWTVDMHHAYLSTVLVNFTVSCGYPLYLPALRYKVDIYCQLQILWILAISLIFGYIVDIHYIPHFYLKVDIHLPLQIYGGLWISTIYPYFLIHGGYTLYRQFLNRYPPYFPILNMGWIPAILSIFQYVEDTHHVANF